MALPIIFSQTLATAVATALVNASATVAANIPFTLVTTVLDVQRRVLITPSGDESLNTFVVVGTNQSGAGITENVAGANATTSYSNLDFKTVTRITALRATAATVSIGTNGVGSSLWQIVNWNAQPFNLGFYVELRSGAANFTVQHTFDDPNNLLTGLAYPTPINNAVVNGSSASAEGSYVTPITAIRLLTNSGTGTLWFRMLQEGLGSP